MGSPLLRSYFRCRRCLVVVAADGQVPPICACSGPLEAMGTVFDDRAPMVKRRADPDPDHDCDASCLSARGPSCNCPCGGINHGRILASSFMIGEARVVAAPAAENREKERLARADRWWAAAEDLRLRLLERAESVRSGSVTTTDDVYWTVRGLRETAATLTLEGAPLTWPARDRALGKARHLLSEEVTSNG